MSAALDVSLDVLPLVPQKAQGSMRFREKLAYGSGAFGSSLAGSMFLFFFSYYLTDVVGLAPLLATVVQVCRNSMNAVTDPIVGRLTDRTRSRWGRRKPFIFLGLLPFGAAFAALWQRPPVHTPWAIVAWFVMLILLYDCASSMVGVAYNALTPELTSDYDERTALNGFRQAFSMVGGLVAGGGVEVLVSRYATPAGGYAVTGLLFGAVAALPFIIVLVGVKERKVPLVPSQPGGLVQMFRSTLQNRPFRIAMAIYLLSWVSVGIASTMFIYFLTHWMKMGAQIGLVLLTVQLSALVSIPGIVWLSNRVGKRAAYIAGISFWVVVQLAMLLLRPEHASWVLPLAACAGVGVGAAHVLPWSMVPDCVELDELRTGERREGAYYGVMSFLEKVGTGLALGGIGLVLQMYGYEGGVPQQTEAAAWAVRMLMGAGPALLLTLSIVAALAYPISKASHAQTLRELDQRRRAQAQA